MINKYLISVITPYYHGEEYICNLLAMLTEATEGLLENECVQWVIVNDEPEDLGYSLKSLSPLLDIQIINTKKNSGTQSARITGVEASEGDFVLMLDQDDKIFPNWFKSQLSHIGKADAVVCDALMDGKAFYGDELRPSFDDALTLEFNLSHTCGFIPGQVLMKRSSISEAWMRNRFSVNHCDDYYLWLCMLLEGKKFVKNSDILYEHITTGNNQSLNRVIWYKSMLEMIHFLEMDGMIDIGQKDRLYANLNKETEACLEDRNWIIEKNVLLSRLLKAYENGIYLSHILIKRGINSVAIYGRAECGIRLQKKLESEGYRVEAFIDKVDFPTSTIPVYKREAIPDNVRCVINTVVKDKEEIKTYICDNYKDILVIHLKNLLDGII